MSGYHRLLRRQLKRAKLEPEVMEKLLPFLAQVNDAYYSFDTDIAHFEHVLEKSSQELFAANQALRRNYEDVTSQLAKVVNNIQEIIFEIDLEGCWLYLNPAWEGITGLSVEDCLGKPFSDFLDMVDRPSQLFLKELSGSHFDSVRRHIKIQSPIHERQHWLDLSIRSLREDDGRIVGYIGTMADITNLKNMQEALMEAKEKATLANQAKADFLSTMSHEIRTPLNAVIGLSHLLLLENPQAEQLESLQALKYSSEHLLGLINDILDFNKIEAGNLLLEEVPFSVDSMLDGLNRIFSHKAREKNIRFLIKRDESLPRVLTGDRTRIFQVLSNLISNAIKFTEYGKVVLDIEVSKDLGDRVLLDFRISDTGIGIAEDKLDYIFESFTQADAKTTRKYGGTGLGLPICKRLIEIMDGTLMVSSEINVGSVFRFFLELAVPRKHQIKDSSEEEEVFRKEDMKDIRVLVAEDNPMNILVIKKFFKRWGIHFDIAENGRIAVQKANGNKYDLILMDLQMPVMNGYDAAQAIRESSNVHNRSIPIFALTASAGIDIKSKVQEYGMDGHISKPFNPGELRQILQKMIFHH